MPLEPASDAPLEKVTVTCWGWTGVARDEGGAAAAWLSDFLERPVRLVRYAGAEARCGSSTGKQQSLSFLGPTARGVAVQLPWQAQMPCIRVQSPRKTLRVLSSSPGKCIIFANLVRLARMQMQQLLQLRRCLIAMKAQLRQQAQLTTMRM